MRRLKIILLVCMSVVCGQVNMMAGKRGEQEAEQKNQMQWLELPAVTESGAAGQITHYAWADGRVQRNYTLLYDPDMYASYWAAYPLCAAHMTTGREDTWAFDPKWPVWEQTNVKRSYGVRKPTKNYPKNFYARGHQVPNADRNAVPQMQAQTYYSTNITPQIQYGFNAAIWKNLEAAVRTCVPQNDTLYVVTGAAFRKQGENLAVEKILSKSDKKLLPIPNYYWKALLKVRRENGKIVGAAAIGFWMPHKDLKGRKYTQYAVSVNQIEEWTGYDLFVNLDDDLESSAESMSSWSRFYAY